MDGCNNKLGAICMWISWGLLPWNHTIHCWLLQLLITVMHSCRSLLKKKKGGHETFYLWLKFQHMENILFMSRMLDLPFWIAGNVHVYSRFHRMLLVWNLGWRQQFPTSAFFTLNAGSKDHSTFPGLEISYVIIHCDRIVTWNMKIT